MRNLKFRTWDKSANLMIKKDAMKYYFKNGGKIMQATGLKDHNGIDIFEGDIIHSTREFNAVHVIYYDEKKACFKAHYGNEEYMNCGVYQKWINEFKKIVIGNVFENPKLGRL